MFFIDRTRNRKSGKILCGGYLLVLKELLEKDNAGSSELMRVYWIGVRLVSVLLPIAHARCGDATFCPTLACSDLSLVVFVWGTDEKVASGVGDTRSSVRWWELGHSTTSVASRSSSARMLHPARGWPGIRRGRRGSPPLRTGSPEWVPRRGPGRES